VGKELVTENVPCTEGRAGLEEWKKSVKSMLNCTVEFPKTRETDTPWKAGFRAGLKTGELLKLFGNTQFPAHQITSSVLSRQADLERFGVQGQLELDGGLEG
jgi:hypothetical protein